MELREGYKKTEIGIIPKDWECKSLASIANFENGKAHENEIEDNGRYFVVNSRFISTEGAVRKYTNKGILLASTNDVLIVMSDVPKGRAIAKCFFVDEDDKYTVNQRIGKISPTSIEPKLLFYKIDRNPFYLSFDDGVKQTNLRKQDILDIVIDVPKSRKEQQAIATALSDIDSLINSLIKLIDKKKNIKQGAMQELLTGKKRLEGFSGEWEEVELGSVCEIKKGQLITEITIEQGNIPVIAGGKQPAYYHKYANRKGRVITISASGANAGYVSFHQKPIFASDCSTIEENKNCDILFIYSALSLKQLEIYNAQSGGAQPHVHPSDLKPLKIFFTFDREEQTAIANILSDMDSEIEALEEKLDKYRDIKQGMMEELLTGRIRLI